MTRKIDRAAHRPDPVMIPPAGRNSFSGAVDVPTEKLTGLQARAEAVPGLVGGGHREVTAAVRRRKVVLGSGQPGSWQLG